MIYALFSLIGIAPLLFYIVDGYYEKNMPKGLKTIALFVTLATITIILTKVFLMLFVCGVPVIIILYLAISYNQRNNFTKNN